MQMQRIQINSGKQARPGQGRIGRTRTGQLNMRITVDNHRINMLTIFSRIRKTREIHTEIDIQMSCIPKRDKDPGRGFIIIIIIIILIWAVFSYIMMLTSARAAEVNKEGFFRKKMKNKNRFVRPRTQTLSSHRKKKRICNLNVK